MVKPDILSEFQVHLFFGLSILTLLYAVLSTYTFLFSVIKYNFYLYIIENWYLMFSFKMFINKASQKPILFLKIHHKPRFCHNQFARNKDKFSSQGPKFIMVQF